MKRFILCGVAIALSTTLAFSDETPDMDYEFIEGEHHQRNIKWDAFFNTFGGYNWSTFQDSDFEENLEDFSYGARASGSYNFENGFSLQKDLVYNRDDFGLEIAGFSSDSGDVTSSDYDAASHFFYQTDKYLFGAIAQIGKTSFDAGGLTQETNRFYFGAEAQKYYGDFTIYGQAGYEKTKADVGFFGPDGYSTDGFIASLEGRYFFTDNWRFDVKGTYSIRQVDTDDLDLDMWTLEAGTEYKFTDTPFSFTSDISWSIADHEGLEAERTIVLVGLKMNLGAETLKSRDRGGATLDPFEVQKPIEALFGLGAP